MDEYSSYKISKRLDDKGFRAEHVWVWGINLYMGGRGLLKGSIPPDRLLASAYTFIELACKLPNKLMLDGHEHVFNLVKMAHGDYHASYTGKWTYAPSAKIHTNPVEAVAMLIEWLVDNGHLKGGV